MLRQLVGWPFTVLVITLCTFSLSAAQDPESCNRQNSQCFAQCAAQPAPDCVSRCMQAAKQCSDAYNKKPSSTPQGTTQREIDPAASASCMFHEITGSQTEPYVLLTNTCNFDVNWALCVNVEGRIARDFATGTTASHSTSTYRMFKDENSTVRYRINHCAGRKCTAPSPSC